MPRGTMPHPSRAERQGDSKMPHPSRAERQGDSKMPHPSRAERQGDSKMPHASRAERKGGGTLPEGLDEAATAISQSLGFAYRISEPAGWAPHGRTR
jgi:hypothetical protein